MDSGNSGSMQSSSGDEEYDSRSESAAAPPPPAFFNFSSNSINNFAGFQNQQPPTFFDMIPSSSYLQAHSQSQSQSQPQPQHNSNPSSFLNLDLVGSRTTRSCSLIRSSEPSCTDSSTVAHQGLINHGSFSTAPSSSHMQQQSRLLVNDQYQTNVVVKNSKKRTRTSRRAPTTVLTTDTSNFRAMVQEFTGIPSQPFSVGSSYSRRLDLFGPGSAIKSSGNIHNHLEPMGGPLNYHLRPATQKFQPNLFSSPSSSSSMIDAIAAAAAAAAASTSHNTSSNYRVLSELGLNSNNNNKEPPNTLNNIMQSQNLNHHPVVSFQSILQHSSPLNNPSLTFGANNKSQASHFGAPSFEDHDHHLAMSHHGSHVGLPNNQDQFRSFDGNFANSSQRATSCKLNYSASSSDFHHNKNLENVPSRGTEGTVDSWICPSD